MIHLWEHSARYKVFNYYLTHNGDFLTVLDKRLGFHLNAITDLVHKQSIGLATYYAIENEYYAYILQRFNCQSKSSSKCTLSSYIAQIDFVKTDSFSLILSLLLKLLDILISFGKNIKFNFNP